MGFLAITLLTIVVIGVTFLAAFLRLWRNPPNVSISIPSINIVLPEKVLLQHQTLPSEPAQKEQLEPIPVDIMEYIAMESEVSAQDARKRRVRELKKDTGSWDAAFRLLQREDMVDV